MFSSLSKAFGDLADPEIRRVMWWAIWLTLALLVLLVWGVWALAGAVEFVASGWAETAIDLVIGAGVVVLAVVLFPAAVQLVASQFADRVVAAVERRHYASLPPASDVGVGAALAVAIKFALVTIGLNLLMLPFYFIPVVNAFVFVWLNGYLLGREQFELVMLRRFPARELAGRRRRVRGGITVVGLPLAGLALVPLVNLMLPVLGAAYMTHLVQRMPEVTHEV